MGLTNIWYYAGPQIFPGGHWKHVLEAFLDAARQLSPVSFEQFDQALERAYRVAPSNPMTLLRVFFSHMVDCQNSSAAIAG